MVQRKLLLSVAAGTAALAGLALFVLPEAPALPTRESWTERTRVAPDAEVPGWFINLGITGARAKLTEAEPKALQVMHIFKDTPASGRLEVGDRIVGANGKPFTTPHKFGYGVTKFGYEGPMMDFGNALEESQGKADGKLVLSVKRAERAVTVELRLPKKYGSFAEKYPYDCKKSDLIFREACAYLVKQQKADGSWSDRPHINAFAALALLGSGNEEYLPAVTKAMKVMAREADGKLKYDGLMMWTYTLYGIALSEYYLLTGDDWVLPKLETINGWLAQAQAPDGGFGHNAHNPKGVGNGYGSFNIGTTQAMMTWGLMQRCGVQLDPKRFAAAHDFIARGTNRIGYVWYAAEGANNSAYADMGRTGASALAHYLSPVGGSSYRDFAKGNAQCIGQHPVTFPDTHGSPILGMGWTALGAATDPAAFRSLMDSNRWCFALAHCPDGTFYYQPNRDNDPQDYHAAPRLAATAVTALIFALKERKLQITGAKLTTRQ